MDARKIEQLTLREKIRDSQQLARDLHEHLVQNFLPKVTELVTVSTPQPDVEERVADVTIRNQAGMVLESERFLAQKEADLSAYAAALFKEVLP